MWGVLEYVTMCTWTELNGKWLLPVSECWLCVAHWASVLQLLCDLNPNDIFKVMGKHQSVQSISGLESRKVSIYIKKKRKEKKVYTIFMQFYRIFMTRNLSTILYGSLNDGECKPSTNNRSFELVIGLSSWCNLPEIRTFLKLDSQPSKRGQNFCSLSNLTYSTLPCN